MKKVKVNVYAEDAVFISAGLNDFDGDVEKWKDAVYQLFRYNMTFSFAHKIDVCESRKSGVFVSLVIKPAFQENVTETMDGLGFKELKTWHEDIGTIEGTDLPDDMLFDFVNVDI